VISVTEGLYVVLKHPMMFLGANVVSINKTDLAGATEFNEEKLMAIIPKLNRRSVTVATSCKKGVGVEDVATVRMLLPSTELNPSAQKLD